MVYGLYAIGIGMLYSMLLFLIITVGDSKRFKMIAGVGGVSSSFFLIDTLIKYGSQIGIPKENYPVLIFLCVLSTIIFFITFIFALYKLGVSDSSKAYLSMYDILRGDKDAINSYTKSKFLEIENEIKAKLNANELEARAKKLLEEERELEQKRVLLSDLIDTQNDLLSKNHNLLIPEEYKYLIKREFLDYLPSYVDRLAKFSHHTSMMTEDVASYDGIAKLPSREAIGLYIDNLCNYIGEYLFDWRNVRVHARVLDNTSGMYKKEAAYHQRGEIYSADITPISMEEGLILKAIETKRSLVRSANLSTALDTENSHVWTDYMTVVANKPAINGKPLITFGVSSKHVKEHQDFMYFLSYIKIEQLLEDQILQFLNAINLTSSLEEVK